MICFYYIQFFIKRKFTENRILLIGGSGSRKTNPLLNLIKEQDDIDKICFYAKDLSEPKNKFWIKCVKMEEENI